MPYKIRYYPKGLTSKRVAKTGTEKISSTSDTTFKTKASAKKSKLYKHLKNAGMSPRLEKRKSLQLYH